MKTIRSLLMCLLFVSVWLCPEPARSFCPVGYVNAALTNGYNFIANPLDNGTNTLTSITHPDTTNVSLLNGSRAYVWDVTNQVFLPPATYVSGWDLNYDLPVGKGFVIFAPSPWTNTFIGSVLCGRSTNFVAGTNKFSLLGSKLPLQGKITSDCGFPGTDGDHVYFFRGASQSFSDAYTYHGGYGWFDPKGVEGTGGPGYFPAVSFFVQNPGPNTNWVQILNLLAGAASSQAVAATATERKVSHISTSGGKVSLKLQDPGGGPYDVQFSTNGLTWTTVARNQSGDTWTGKLSDAMSGYFHAVTSQAGASKP